MDEPKESIAAMQQRFYLNMNRQQRRKVGIRGAIPLWAQHIKLTTVQRFMDDETRARRRGRRRWEHE